MAEVEVQIDASTGSITARGEQAFVSEIIEKYRFVFENAPKPAPLPPPSPPIASANAGEVKSKTVSANGLEAYENVFDVEGDAVSILVSPPGNSMAVQARALILLYLYARHKMSAEPTPIELIKEQCKAHACFDPPNFNKHLKSQKNLITVTGANSSTTARLTVPGRKAAEELAQKLNTPE